MRIHEFTALESNDQYEAVWEQGVFVDSIITDNISFQLYSINDFFIEIQYSVPDNKIIGKVPFNDGSYLDKYLNFISPI